MWVTHTALHVREVKTCQSHCYPCDAISWHGTERIGAIGDGALPSELGTAADACGRVIPLAATRAAMRASGVKLQAAVDAPFREVRPQRRPGRLGGFSLPRALNVLGQLRPVAQQVFKGGGVLSCGVLLALWSVGLVVLRLRRGRPPRPLLARAQCARWAAADGAAGAQRRRCALVQRIARRGEGDACARGAASAARAAMAASPRRRTRVTCSTGRCCCWAAGAHGRRRALRARTARCVWSMVLVLIGVRHMASKQCGFSGGEGGLDGLSSLHSFEGFCVLR